ncbi:MAG: hypothetical protein JRI25_23335 [Deltaproteobacteria bacterium]|nr:hypothetical protein [Deltaproteobacteria bacterium]
MNDPVPVELYVIGFGASAQAASDTLAAMARAAEVTSGPDNFYQTDTVEGLLERLYRVAASLQPCDIVLEEAPPADELQVWFNQRTAARSLHRFSLRRGLRVRSGVGRRPTGSGDLPKRRRR